MRKTFLVFKKIAHGVTLSPFKGERSHEILHENLKNYDRDGKMGLYHKLLFHWIKCHYLNVLKMFIFVIKSHGSCCYLLLSDKS